MKRKKSRHKQAAVDFLSRISLQGYTHDTTSSLTAAASKTALYKFHRDTSGAAFNNDQQICRAANFRSKNGFGNHMVIQHSKKDNLDSSKVQNDTNIVLPHLRPFEKSCVQNGVLNHVYSTTVSIDDDRCHNRGTEELESSLLSGVRLTITDCSVGPVQPSAPGRRQQPNLKSSESSETGSWQSFALKPTGAIPPPSAARRLIIACAPHQSPLTLCSILPYARRAAAAVSPNRPTYRTSLQFNTVCATSILGAAATSPNTAAGGVAALHHHSVGSLDSSSLCVSGPPGTNRLAVLSAATKECTPMAGFHMTLNGNGAICRASHSFRQVGDEVISVSGFLRHCQPSFSTPWSNVLQHFHYLCFRLHHRQCTSCGNKSTGVASDGNARGSVQVPGYCTCHSSLRSDELVGETALAEHVGDGVVTNECDISGRPIQTTSISSRCPGASRNRVDSFSKRAASPIVSPPFSYPDPLIHYFPNLLDDPDLLVATGKRFMQLPSYLATVLTYVRPGEQKRNVNLEFHNRFPNVQLTLTKLRSLKSVIVRIVHKVSLDLWIAAHAHVLFEKLILRLVVNKLNRKAYASAALLISAKLNDVKGSELTVLIQEIENMFRISRRDIIHTEIDAFFNLEFHVIPAESDIFPHYLRILKDIDVAPLAPSVCIYQNLLQLIPNSVISQHGSRGTAPG